LYFSKVFVYLRFTEYGAKFGEGGKENNFSNNREIFGKLIVR